MPFKVLIDPLIVAFDTENMPDSLIELDDAILGILSIINAYPLELVPFLSSDHVNSIKNNWKIYQTPSGGREIAALLSNLELNGHPEFDPAQVVSTPVPRVGDVWLRVLAQNGCNCATPSWRNPIVLLSENTDEQWPTSHEIQYTAAAINRIRSLVRIESYRSHPFIIADIDPWRLNALGEPVALTASIQVKRRSWKRLPRPPSLPLKFTFQELCEKLRRGVDCSADFEKNLYYVPRNPWNPIGIEKVQWRNASCFETRTVRIKKRNRIGYLDCNEWVWVWDENEAHWDVQKGNGEYSRVRYDGQILT